MFVKTTFLVLSSGSVLLIFDQNELDRCGVLSGSSLPVVKLIKVMVTARHKG